MGRKYNVKGAIVIGKTVTCDHCGKSVDISSAASCIWEEHGLIWYYCLMCDGGFRKPADVTNHNGYGLRNDERPYAHKIPPGGNWRDLPRDDQIAFMKGAINGEGGRTTYLRRLTWDEPALTVLAAPMAKATCQLHPGSLRKETVSITNYNVTPQREPNGLTVAEVFSGGGLMAVGLKAAGYRIVWANDFDKNACNAYRHNIGDHVIHGDITQIDPDTIPDVDVIAGGPPCQDYSVAGNGAGEDGERGKLVWTYLSVIERKKPKAFVFENVKGLVGKRHRQTFDALLERFDAIGYNVSWRLINAWDYGVAQKRERVFIVGVRKDLGFTFEFPEPEASGYRTQVLRDVIGDLPEPNSGVNAHIQTQATTVKKLEGVYNQRTYKADWNKPAKTVCTNRLDHAEIHPGLLVNHEGGVPAREYPPKHTASNLDCPAKTIVADANGVPGGANCFIPENHDAKSFWTPKREYAYDQANRVQSMDDPSNTIPAHHNSGQPIHPTQAPRRFTVRECLRIQSVPDSYVLPADISLSAQYRIVGNGVASRVAYVIGNALAAQLNGKLTEVRAVG